MARFSISLDTESRQLAMVLDGELIPFNQMDLYVYEDVDGGRTLYFSYSTTIKNENGMEESRRFFLPALDKDGVESIAGAKIDAKTGLHYKEETVAESTASFLRKADS